MKLYHALFALLALAATPALAQKKTVGIGLNLGSNALYGNSVSMHYKLWDHGEINGGIGYNSSGAKIGAGHAFLIDITSGIGLVLAQALTYSGGRDSDVEVDATLTPEGTTKEEEFTALKSYELGPAALFGVGAGAYWDFFKWLKFNFMLTYSVAFWGNEVELGRRVTYDKEVEVTNEPEFHEELDKEIKKEVGAGGLGFSTGAAIWF